MESDSETTVDVMTSSSSPPSLASSVEDHSYGAYDAKIHIFALHRSEPIAKFGVDDATMKEVASKWESLRNRFIEDLPVPIVIDTDDEIAREAAAVVFDVIHTRGRVFVPKDNLRSSKIICHMGEIATQLGCTDVVLSFVAEHLDQLDIEEAHSVSKPLWYNYFYLVYKFGTEEQFSEACIAFTLETEDHQLLVHCREGVLPFVMAGISATFHDLRAIRAKATRSLIRLLEKKTKKSRGQAETPIASLRRRIFKGCFARENLYPLPDPKHCTVQGLVNDIHEAALPSDMELLSDSDKVLFSVLEQEIMAELDQLGNAAMAIHTSVVNGLGPR